MGKCYIVKNKTASQPRRPYDKERIDKELKLIGQFGLRNKRECWRVNLILSVIRRKARFLLTLDEKVHFFFDLKFLFSVGLLLDFLVAVCSVYFSECIFFVIGNVQCSISLRKCMLQRLQFFLLNERFQVKL